MSTAHPVAMQLCAKHHFSPRAVAGRHHPNRIARISCSAAGQPARHSRPVKAAWLVPFFAWQAAAATAADEALEGAQDAVQSAASNSSYPKLDVTSYPAAKAVQAARDSGFSVPDVQLPDLNGVADAVAANPAILAGGVALLAIPLLIGALSGGGKIKGISAAKALNELASNPQALFLDLRNTADIKAQGKPDLRSVKARLNSLPFTKVIKGEVAADESFGDKVQRLKALDQDSTVILLDSYGQEAKAAGAVLVPFVKQVLYVNGGAEGNNGWRAAELPWQQPSRGFNLSGLKNITQTIDDIAEDFKAQPTLNKAGLAVGALGAASFVLFQELEVVLEVLGAVAAGNWALNNLLFAKDRDKTLTEVRSVVKDKIALDDLPKDLRKVAARLNEGNEISAGQLNQAIKASADTLSQESKQIAADVAAKAKSAGKQVEKQAGDPARETQKAVASAGKEVKKEAQSLGSKAGSATDTLQKDAKPAGQQVKQQAASAGKEVKKAAQSLGSKAGSATDNVQKDAKSAGQQKMGSSAASENGAPSKADVKGQAEEARQWIDEWRSGKK